MGGQYVRNRVRFWRVRFRRWRYQQAVRFHHFLWRAGNRVKEQNERWLLHYAPEVIVQEPRVEMYEILDSRY